MIIFASHDTPANKLAFSMLPLAQTPRARVWLVEEKREPTMSGNSGEGDYRGFFSDLK